MDGTVEDTAYQNSAGMSSPWTPESDFFDRWRRSELTFVENQAVGLIWRSRSSCDE